MYGKVREEDCDVVEFHNHCTDTWLGIICFLMFLQTFVIVGVGVTGVMLYDANQAEIQAWIDLPWANMAHSVDKGFTNLEAAPIEGTLSNAYLSSEKLKYMLDYHDRTTFSQLKIFSDELVENKDLLKRANEAIRETIPAVKKVQRALGDEPVQDLQETIHKIRHIAMLLDDKELKQTYDAVSTFLATMNVVVTPENVDGLVRSAKSISHAVDTSLTPENVNKTVHAIEDFEKTMHKAESTVGKICLILGNQ